MCFYRTTSSRARNLHIVFYKEKRPFSICSASFVIVIDSVLELYYWTSYNYILINCWLHKASSMYVRKTRYNTNIPYRLTHPTMTYDNVYYAEQMKLPVVSIRCLPISIVVIVNLENILPKHSSHNNRNVHTIPFPLSSFKSIWYDHMTWHID